SGPILVLPGTGVTASAPSVQLRLRIDRKLVTVTSVQRSFYLDNAAIVGENRAVQNEDGDRGGVAKMIILVIGRNDNRTQSPMDILQLQVVALFVNVNEGLAEIGKMNPGAFHQRDVDGLILHQGVIGKFQPAEFQHRSVDFHMARVYFA